MKCPNCQTLNPDGARFCMNCGNTLSTSCSNCGTNLQPDARFCHRCGQPVPHIEITAPVDPSPVKISSQPQIQAPTDLLQRYIPKELLSKLEAAQDSGLMAGERRIVTILFCDVKGSTLAASKLDPEEWSEIINGAFAHMIQPIYHYEGTVARLQGDGLLAFFGAPVAHEDDPQRAVLAGLDIVQAIQLYGGEVHKQWGIDFNVRVGINTGLVVVGAVGSDLRLEYTALGDAINIAARMEQTAHPGTVQIAEATYKLVAPLFDFNIIENAIIKGLDAPVTLYQPVQRKAEPDSLRGIAGLNAPLIGRKAQMDSLWLALTGLAEGSGQILSVIGEAGLGKSRLIAEFQRETQMDSSLNLIWLEGRSLSYEAARPFSLFIDLFSRYFKINPADPSSDNYEKILDSVDNLLPGRGNQIAPFFATLLGIHLDKGAEERVRYLEPPLLRDLIFSHVEAVCKSVLSRQSTVFYLDDVHWIDPTSLELLYYLLPLTRTFPLLVITAFRPGEQEPSWGFHETAAREYPSHYRTISLQPLDGKQSRDLVANLLHIEDLPGEVRKKILDKAEGNPFFVEELIRSLLDDGLVVRESGHWRATKEIHHIDLPNTLAGVITARLDRLEEPVKYTLQSASVLGREFSSEILADITQAAESMENNLSQLMHRELIRGNSSNSSNTYSFKHVLTQEAVYSSILLSNRRELHRRAADALIARTPDLPAEIARHLLEARQAVRAVPYLIQAGERATKAYATAEAISYFQKALEFRSAIQDLDLLRKGYEGLGGALSFANQIPQALQTYQEMLSAAQAAENIPMHISALNKLAGVTGLLMGQFQEAEQYLDRAEQLSRLHAEKSDFPEMALIRCQMCTAKADFNTAVLYMGEVVEIGNELNNQEHTLLGLEHVSASLVYMTRYDEALVRVREGLQVARQIGNREYEALFLAETLPLIYIRNGDFQAARKALQEGVQIAEAIGSLTPQALGGYLLAELSRWQGDYQTALTYGRQALEAALPLEPYMPYYVVPVLGVMGMIYLDISEGLRDQISEFHLHALRLLESPTSRIGGGSAWADLGHCALALGDNQIANEVFQLGLDYPNIFIRLERPRHLAGKALLACVQGEFDLAVSLADEARSFAGERGMRHMVPFVDLVRGKVLRQRGELEASLDACELAEREAVDLGMRPTIWQARLIQAEIYARLGQKGGAQEKKDQARAVIDEIAAAFSDERLRELFLANAQSKIPTL